MVFGFKSKEEKLQKKLKNAIYYGNQEAALKLIEEGVLLNDPELGSALYKLFTKYSKWHPGDFDMMILLIKHGARPNDWTLSLAKTKVPGAQLLEVWEYLLDNGADVNEGCNDNSLLHLAVVDEDQEITKLLIRKGADLTKKDSKGRTPLCNAIARGSRTMVRLYLKETNCLSEEADKGDRAPLYTAIVSDKPDLVIIKMLLEHGADVDATCINGVTALHKAIQLENKDIVYLLLEYNAKTNIPNARGSTSLHYAGSSNPSKGLLTLLLNNGADLQAVTKRGRTPLHLFLLNLHTEPDTNIINLFLDRGADPTVEDLEGDSPQSIAREKWGQHIVDLLSRSPTTVKLSKPERTIGQHELEQEARWKEKRERKRQADLTRRKDIQVDEVQSEQMWHGASQYTNANAAAKWLLDTQQLQYILQGDINEDDRVRIAIIDSGIYAEHPQLALVRGYKDFVTGNDKEMIDRTRHGSTGVDLVSEICPDADIYVARVFEGTEAEDETPDLIAKAIEYAVNEWEVDVISLASGLKHAHTGIREAIHSASANGTIVFAAASNLGSVGGILFPGRMYIEYTVMCMFASSGMGKAKNEFNPEPKREFNNFACLGENVPLYSHLTEKVGSGTSYATFVAAAVAGLILDFSRQADVHAEVEDLKKLSTVHGMSAVFELMAKGGRDGNYDCIVPLKLLGNSMILDREKNRKRI